MTSINTRLPYVLVLTIIIFLVIIFGLNKRIASNNTEKKDIQVVLPDLTPTPLPETTATPSAKKKIIAATATATSKATETNNPNTTNNNTNAVSTATATPQPTSAPTATPVASTPQPTQQPETINIQFWIKGWWYSDTGRQYSADGDIKIYKDSTLIATGFYNSYEEPYKISNIPTNSNITVQFYMGTCGQSRQISTGNTSTLHQLDFSFYPNTVCL